MGKMQATSPFWLSAKLGLIKIPADEVNWRGTSHGSETLSNLHPVAPVQLALLRHPCATRTDTCTTRFIISYPNILFPSRPATITLVWALKVFPDVHTGLIQFGKPFSFNLNLLVTLVHDAIHRQPLARHAKIKEQFDKMESEGKICRQYKPTAWCSDVTIRGARTNLESV